MSRALGKADIGWDQLPNTARIPEGEGQRGNGCLKARFGRRLSKDNEKQRIDLIRLDLRKIAPAVE